MTANIHFGIFLGNIKYNTVIGNNITNNESGIWLFGSVSSNSIYHNRFVDNTQQVHEQGISANSANIWDDGSHGNYWSDYLTKYPNATEIDNSGIGNTPHMIDANNTDHYPLLVPSVTIPEFPSLLVSSLLIVVTLLGLTLQRKRKHTMLPIQSIGTSSTTATSTTTAKSTY